MPFYVTLTAQVRELRAAAAPRPRDHQPLPVRACPAAFLAQWLTGLLVGLTADAGRIGSPSGYRLVFGFLAAHAARQRS